MKQQLIAHIEQRFAGAALNRENLNLKEQVTRDALLRYDMCIAEGKAPEEALRDATESIGEIRLHNPPATQPQKEEKKKGRGPVCGAVTGGLWALTLVAYFLVSRWTGKWEITWLIFIIGAAATSISEAIFDLCKGGCDDEK